MTSLKTIGRSGQITLGKEYAGRQVIVDQPEPGIWIIKAGSFVPDSEKWLHTKKTAARLEKAISWAENNPPTSTDLTELKRKTNK